MIGFLPFLLQPRVGGTCPPDESLASPARDLQPGDHGGQGQEAGAPGRRSAAERPE